MSRISDQVIHRTQSAQLLEQLLCLSPSDVNSLLIAYYEALANQQTPARLLKTFQKNRFARPSDLESLSYHALELELLSLAKQNLIYPILLSSAAPFGSCSALGPISQNRVVSATRGTEILSDATNVLAMQAALTIKEITDEKSTQRQPLHLCSTDRLVRAQMFKGAAQLAQFGLFSVVSAGRDTGSYRCEKDLLKKQLGFYKSYLTQKNMTLKLVVTSRLGYPNANGFFEQMQHTILSFWPDAECKLITDNEKNPYYLGLNFKLYAMLHEQLIEIGDGGFVDWTQQLLQNKKERLLISAISLDRILSLI